MPAPTARSSTRRSPPLAKIPRLFILLAAVAAAAACQPSNQTPGQWLRGEVAQAFPADWRFTDSHNEIAIEVSTPYRIPHSVTIWCAQVDGQLYVAARDPETKKWPGWVDAARDVRLKIGDTIYPAALADLVDEPTLTAVKAAYAIKYDLKPPVAGKISPVKYWAVKPRA